MALFSRRKKSDDVVDETPQAAAESVAEETEETPEESVPDVNISVQAFRGVGAQAGPEVAAPQEEGTAEPAPAQPSAPRATATASAEAQQAAAQQDAERRLPLASVNPPAQKHTVEGMQDNILLRNALAELQPGPTNEQLLGVLRQSLQGHLYLRVHGDARAQLSEGGELSVAMAREGDQTYLLAYSSGLALRTAVQSDGDSAPSSAVAQPVAAIYKQVVDGGMSGIIIDGASAPNRVVFPTELISQALGQADPELTIKGLLAAPRAEDTSARIAEALAAKRVWVAVSDGSNGQPVGIAEGRLPDGRRILQVFTHPLEVVALGRKERAMPFEPERLAKVLRDHEEVAGVLIDPAGPAILVEREALGPVLVLAVDIDD